MSIYFLFSHLFSIKVSIKPSLTQLGLSSVCYSRKTPMKSDFEKIEFNFSHIKVVQKRHSRIVQWPCGLSKDSSFSLSAPPSLAYDFQAQGHLMVQECLLEIWMSPDSGESRTRQKVLPSSF